MTAATVYSCTAPSNSVRKETVIYDNLEGALTALAEVDHRVVDKAFDAGIRRPTGLARIATSEKIIALGRAAHTALADFQKRTLITRDLGLDNDGDGEGDGDLAEDIDRFVWSCVNTLKVVALGEGAWRSVQMLPTCDRRFYDVPPLRMATPGASTSDDSVLVINHDAEDLLANRLADLLTRSGRLVERAGAGGRGDLRTHAGETCWSGDASIHVHVGHHSIRSDELRLVDSWQSRRLAVHLLPGRPQSHDALMVENEVNGFFAATPEAIVAILDEIRGDRVMRRKVIEAGYRTVEPLASKWTAIAEDLLA